MGDHGIKRSEHKEEQPTDKARAQDPSSAKQDKEQGKPPAGQSEKRE